MKRLLSIALLAATLSAQSFDGNGALEGFYKPHHSHRRALITIGILIGSGVATGILASRSARPPIGRPAAFTPDVTPTFSVNRIGIGGPGIPVAVVTTGGNH